MLPLIALFIAAFAFGTTEFVIAGVLPQVADGLGVSIPTAGYLVSGYAGGIAIGGPLLTLATKTISRKALLLGLAAAFTIGQAACALAPDFASMLLLRIAVAVAHGAYFGVAMVVAVGVVRHDQRGMAVALILSGLTVSNVIGVPAGTAIGNIWGWRATFWVMCALGVASIAAMAALLPRKTGSARQSVSFGSEVRVLARQQVWTSLIIMLMLMIGQFGLFTYITPTLLEITGLDEDLVPWVLLLNGIGATIGVFLGGRLADWKLMPSLITMLFMQAVTLAVIYAVSPYPVPMVGAIIIWGGLSFAIGTPIQTRILTWTADASNLASSLIPAGFNIGIALAASLGAAMLNAGYGYRSLPVVGAMAMLVAVVVALVSHIREWRSRAAPPMPAAAE
ncbi:MAG: MFS transporter [Mesorhizobium sp.]|uniref:MFS transporter n=2 Tax=Mesorhizobium TaxID=68287 RepID=UPI000FCBFC89|nr:MULTISPECIES: MFS transporter [unclassified Mesorhizobium]RUV68490.1 MFS transporter [Mesorhizobium sp. M5C.F.Cr.IN.023.01.1.1]RWF84348.1 MAG: MFS transporter [Mesorhizobium sp.]RWF92545.1 MAG: MFS transporter [Mesorhizobium sp.]RWI40483.1 MAG: MFS transporter [Mesorhizobium sp.]RWI53807.1 MAG: MFS transporter [Mesorhizobium sp.]